MTLSNQYTTVVGGRAGDRDASVPDDADARGSDSAERHRRALGHRSRTSSRRKCTRSSFGIQRELPWATAVEARYVGTFGRDIWRGTDFNQVKISPEFLADFNRARSNGYLAQQAGLAFSPVFNPAVPGSVPLTVLPTFGTALLTNSTVDQQPADESGRRRWPTST